MSIWLKKRSAGVVPGVEWTSDGDVQEVTDEAMALDLLDRGDGEFTQVARPAGARPSDEAKAAKAVREVAETKSAPNTTVAPGATAATSPTNTPAAKK